MNLGFMNQYFDTFEDMGSVSKTNTILLPHSPDVLTGIAVQIREAAAGAG